MASTYVILFRSLCASIVSMLMEPEFIPFRKRINGARKLRTTSINAQCVVSVASLLFPLHFCNLRSLLVNAEWLFLLVLLQTGKTVTSVATTASGKFSIKVEKRTIDYVEYVEANYLMIASGSSEQVVLTFSCLQYSSLLSLHPILP